MSGNRCAAQNTTGVSSAYANQRGASAATARQNGNDWFPSCQNPYVAIAPTKANADHAPSTSIHGGAMSGERALRMVADTPTQYRLARPTTSDTGRASIERSAHPRTLTLRHTALP